MTDQEKIRILEEGVLAVHYLIDNTDGVFAPGIPKTVSLKWSDIRTGGQHSEWLKSFDRALDVVNETPYSGWERPEDVERLMSLAGKERLHWIDSDGDIHKVDRIGYVDGRPIFIVGKHHLDLSKFKLSDFVTVDKLTGH